MAWAKTGWPKRRTFTIAAGAVSADLTGFPVMVYRKNDADLLTARRDGRDIAFADSSDTQVPHELIDYFSGIEHESGWVWFTRPSALRYVGTQDRTYVTYQQNNGAITIIQWDHTTDAWSTPFDLHAPGDTANLYVQEDHGPAAILVRASDKRLLTFYAGHAGPDIHMRVSTNPEDATAWGAEVNLDSALGMQAYSYANPVQFADGTIWLVFRARNSPVTTPTRWYYSESTDGGATWGAAVEFFTTDAYGYVQLAQNGETLYFHANPNHPRFDSANGLYAWRYVKGTGWQTLGGSTLTLPITKASISPFTASGVIYNGAGTGGRCWLWDIAVGDDGHPRVLYSRCGDTANHIIHYARWTGSAWADTLIVNSGSHIGSWRAENTNYQDDWYSGGACFNHSDLSEVYISREVSGPPHEIWRYTTADNGATWAGSAVTEASKRRNFRPIVPRNPSTELKVLWRYGVQPDYEHHLTGVTCDPPRPRVNELAARVKLNISAASGATFYAYWGKADATAQEDRANVWAAADKLVWSGRDAYSSSVSAVSDSTSNGNNGSKELQNEPYEAAGRIFRAQVLDGSDRIAFGTGVNMAGQAALTVLAGVRYAGGGTDEHTILNNWSNTAAGIIFRIDPTTTPANRVEAFVRATGDTQIGGTASLTVTPDTWTTVGMRYSAAGLFAVKNGSTESLAAYGGAMDADASAALYAGRYSDLFPTTEFFTGSMENLLISFEAKSEAYLGAWHSTWDAPGTFSTAGSVEDETPPPPPPPASVNMAGIRPTGTYATGTELLWASAPAAIPLEIAQESDAAVSLLLARALQVAEETSAAFNLLMAQVLGVAVESGEAVQLLQPGALEAAQETDEAVPLVLISLGAITAAEEQDQAVALQLISPIALGVAVEASAALQLGPQVAAVSPTLFSPSRRVTMRSPARAFGRY